MKSVAQEMFETAEKKNMLFQKQHIQEILHEIEVRANIGLYKLKAELTQEEVLELKEMGFRIHWAELPFLSDIDEFIIEWDFRKEKQF